MLKKQTSQAFGKKVFLLGRDSEGVKYWLEEAKWECKWYWGFGYIETYTRNNDPAHSKDISSHQHADNFMSEWFTEWNGSKPRLVERTFTDKEGWELSELFQQFYLLREAAEYFGRGKANCADTKIKLFKKPELVNEINEDRMPVIIDRIYSILSPKGERWAQ